MAKSKTAYKISEEFKLQMQFFVKGKDGNIIKVPKGKFQKEALKYIKLGYGGYFDITQEESMKITKKHLEAEKKAAQKVAFDIEEAHKSNEEKDAALLKLDGEVKVLDTALNEAKDLVDEQQTANANLVVEKGNLETAVVTANAATDKANSEKEALAAEVKNMQKQIAAMKNKP